MADQESSERVTLREAVERRGPYAVWELMGEEEQRAAAQALWENADRESRAVLDLTLARELKFRPQSVRRLPAERVVGRLVRLADGLPENVLFQFLFHLHMAERRELMVRFLDQVGLPHDNGVLELAEDAEPPDPAKVAEAAEALVADDAHRAQVYLSTLKVADADFWSGADAVLERYDESGDPLPEPAKKAPKAKPKKKATSEG